jgi:hypothetical protein
MVNIRHNQSSDLTLGVGFKTVEDIIPAVEIMEVRPNMFCMFISNEASNKRPELVRVNLTKEAVIQEAVTCVVNTVDTFGKAFDSINKLNTTDKMNIRLAIQTHIARATANGSAGKIKLI